MQVEIMMALEEKFDIQLDEDNAEQIVTVQHAADLIHGVVTAKKA
jgi:acyl carrier protein